MNCTPIRVALATLAATFCLPAQAAPVARSKQAPAPQSAASNERLQVRLAEVIAMLEEDDLTAEQRAEAKKKLVEIQKKLQAGQTAPTSASGTLTKVPVTVPAEGQRRALTRAAGAAGTFVVQGQEGEPPVAVARGALRGLTVKAAEGDEVAVARAGQRVTTVKAPDGGEVAVVVESPSAQDPKPAQSPKAPKPPKAPKAPKPPKDAEDAKTPQYRLEVVPLKGDGNRQVVVKSVDGKQVEAVEIDQGELKRALVDVDKLRVKAEALRDAGEKLRIEARVLEDGKLRLLKAGEAFDTRDLKVDELRKLGATLRAADGVKDKRVLELLHGEGFTKASGAQDPVKVLVERARKAEKEGDAAQARRIYVKADQAKAQAADEKKSAESRLLRTRAAAPKHSADDDDDDDDREIRKLIDEMRAEMKEIRALLNELRRQQPAAPRGRARSQNSRDDDGSGDRDDFVPAGGSMFGVRSAPRGGPGGGIGGGPGGGAGAAAPARSGFGAFGGMGGGTAASGEPGYSTFGGAMAAPATPGAGARASSGARAGTAPRTAR